MSERRRDLPSSGPWLEQHRVVGRCSVTSGQLHGPLGIAFQVGVHCTGPNPDRGRTPAGPSDQASFQAAVAFGAGPRSPIVLAADGIPVPRSGWELRTSGLWADHNCETPYQHWSYGLEAFALAVDEHTELLGRGYGERTPLGWELDFEASDEVTPIDRSSTGLDGYAQSGRLHGLVQFADGEAEVDGAASRWRWWGDGSAEGGPLHGTAGVGALALPTPDGVWWVDPLGSPPS